MFQMAKNRGVSYWHTPDDQPLQWLTFPQLIDQWAEKKPQKEAYVVRMNGRPREAITFGELKQKTEHLAAAFLELGLCPGDFVLITGISSINWILADLACASIGVTTIRCRMSVLTKEGLLHITNTYNVKALFYHPGETGELHKHLFSCIPDAFKESQHDAFCADIPCLKNIISLCARSDVLCVDDLLTKHVTLDHMRDIKAKIQPESIITVFMTSGSTGFPKAIPYSHFQLANILQRFSAISKFLKEDDRFFNDRSLSWGGSFMHLPLVFGSCHILLHPLTNAKDNDINFCVQVK